MADGEASTDGQPVSSPPFHAHFDCFGGAAADSMLAACLDAAGKDIEPLILHITECIKSTKLLPDTDDEKFSLQTKHQWKEGVGHVLQAWFNPRSLQEKDSTAHAKGPILTLPQVLKLLKESPDIPPIPREQALNALTELATAKATTSKHGSVDNVHLQLSTVLETVATFLALDFLHVATVSCSRLPMGEATGNSPVPSPTTLLLMLGTETCPGTPGDLVTAPAAAMLRVMARGNAQKTPESFVPCAVGMGCSSQGQDVCMRLILGTIQDEPSECLKVTPSSNSAAIPKQWRIDKLLHFETNLDDTTPEIMSFVVSKLLESGAVDAWVQPIVMKKGRAAHTLSCLVREEFKHAVLQIMFRETSTLGIRIQRLDRAALRREFVSVPTPYMDDKRKGIVNVKVGYLGDEAVSVKAEFDHCQDVARGTGVPLKHIANYAAAQVQAKLDARSTQERQERTKGSDNDC